MNTTGFMTALAIMATVLLTNCTHFVNANVNVNNGKDSDATIKKTVSVGSFTEIEAQQGIKVIFRQGSNPGSVSVATTPSAEKHLRVKVEDNTLKVYYDNRNGEKKNNVINGPSIITVTNDILSEVDLSSCALFTIEKGLKQNGKLDIECNSGSEFKADYISVSELDIDASSAANVTIDDLSGNLDADCSSAASVSINGSAKSDSMSLEASSAASISVGGIDSRIIDAEASSASSITLSGKTAQLKKESSSAAKINTSKLSVGK